MLVFATGNLHKIREIREILGTRIPLLSLEDIGAPLDLPETSDTIEGNALQKAQYIIEHYKMDCFAEDTGLEIDALNGDPGVLSARYAGEDKDPNANINLVLQRMKGISDRNARFKTVIALFWRGETHLFEGIVNGVIRQMPSGTGGFGYDSIFQPVGHDKTFAELSPMEKNQVSHRGRAVRSLVNFLGKRS